jgi:hypothetical protein
VREKDPRTLEYSIFCNDEETECIVIERFRSSEALMEHAANIAELGEAILRTGSVSGALLGEPSQKLAAQMGDAPVQIFKPFLSL